MAASQEAYQEPFQNHTHVRDIEGVISAIEDSSFEEEMEYGGIIVDVMPRTKEINGQRREPVFQNSYIENDGIIQRTTPGTVRVTVCNPEAEEFDQAVDEFMEIMGESQDVNYEFQKEVEESIKEGQRPDSPDVDGVSEYSDWASKAWNSPWDQV